MRFPPNTRQKKFLTFPTLGERRNDFTRCSLVSEGFVDVFLVRNP